MQYHLLICMFCQNLLVGGYMGHSSLSLNNLPLPEETKSTEMCEPSALISADQRGRSISFNLLAAFLLVMSRRLLLFLCTRTPKSFPAKLLSGESDRSLYRCIGFFKVRIWHFTLLNFMRFQSAYFSNLLRSLWIVALPSILLIAPLILCHLQICCECFPSHLSGH